MTLKAFVIGASPSADAMRQEGWIARLPQVRLAPEGDEPPTVRRLAES
jgi:hypothetical protein